MLTSTPTAQGGNAVWGNATFAPDDASNDARSHGELILFRESAAAAEGAGSRLSNLTADEASTWILEHTPTQFQVCRASNLSSRTPSDSVNAHRK